MATHKLTIELWADEFGGDSIFSALTHLIYTNLKEIHIKDVVVK